MQDKKKILVLLAAASFAALFLALYFAYFLPVKQEHAHIAKLPSHDLTLFVDESGQFAHNDMAKGVTYNGQVCRTKEDFLRVLGGDAFAGSLGYYYFYDAQHNLVLNLGMDTQFRNGDGSASYFIGAYPPFGMYFDSAFEPFVRGLTLGPLLSWNFELSDDNSSQVGRIAEARYWFLYQYSSGDWAVSAVSASVQLALAFTLYLMPAFACLLWRRKKVIFSAAGTYVLLGIFNVVYYLWNYPWLSF